HGGLVSLVEITPESAAVLQFGGGCQGCAAVDITLKNSVEVTLLERIPELTAILDQTDHSVTDNAYYR
ncbi:MAG: Fe-S biogenesis protein NfuA, partial [Gammaproteobacteria bacterium]|nr:Fe-S biogenesis protein NfuA [Gammaproteobacteria bacterium]